MELLWAFMTGLAGSLHCLGMCGPLVIAYSLHLSPPQGHSMGQNASVTPSFAHHAAFHSGRTISYGLLGSMAAGLVYLGSSHINLRDIRTPISVAGGIGMIIMGLIISRVFSVLFLFKKSGSAKASLISRYMERCFASRRPVIKGILGFLSGFLPCMLSWAMILKAATSANVLSGFLVMVVFGLGTIPALLFTGFFASLFSLKGRFAGERLSGLSIVAMGLIMLWKGVLRLA